MRLTVFQDPMGVLGRETTEHEKACIVDLLKEIPGFHRDNSEVYLNGQLLKLPQFENDVCIDRGDEELLTKTCENHDRVVVFLETKGLETVAIAAIVISVVAVTAAFLLTPKIPGNVGETKQSSNNTLFGQENTARPYQAIPDSYGELVLFPDLANAEAYFTYVGNEATLIQYMTIGVGEYEVGPVRLGKTLLSQIPGATATFYEPVSGNTTVPDYFTSLQVAQVEGQELRGTEGAIVQIDEDFFTATYNAGLDEGTLNVAAPGENPLFNGSFSPGDNVIIVNSDFFYSPGSQFAKKGINGTFVVVSVTDRQMVVGNITAGADDLINWTTHLATFENWQRDDIRFIGDPDVEKPIGPFDTAVRGRGVLLDFNFPRGLKRQVDIKIEWEVIDEPGGSPISALTTNFVSYNADSFNTQNRTFTIDLAPTASAFFRVTVTRTNPASQDASEPDLVKWSRMASWTFDDFKVFPDNVTMLRVDIPQTEQALSPRENKVNFDATRKTITYDTNTSSIASTLSPSKTFADAVLHMYTVVFNRPANELDLDGLYQTQESIDPLLAEFGFSFDDLDVGLEERLQTICAVARVTPYSDGNLYRFTRDEIKPFPSGLITRRDLAADREFSRTWSPRLPADTDSVKLEYVDPSTNKKAYITRAYNVSGNVVEGLGANPVEIKLAGCRNETQAINRAELEIRKILYERETITDTMLSQGNLYDIGDRVEYADVYSQDKFDGELKTISGLTATTSELVPLDPVKDYTLIYNDDLGEVYGPYSVEATAEKEITLLTGNFDNAYIKDGLNIQLGSRYIISEVGDSDPESFVVTQKTPGENGKVQISLKQYDERVYAFD